MYTEIFIMILILSICFLVGWLIWRLTRKDSSGSQTPESPESPEGKTPVSDDPVINSFRQYLEDKMQKALRQTITNSKTDQGFSYNEGIVMTCGIYVSNTPGNRGPVKTWATACGNGQGQTCSKIDSFVNKETAFEPTSFKKQGLGVTTEPSYYFGSATKPITATLVANQLYKKVWRPNNPDKDPEEFFSWYRGKNEVGGCGAVTYGELWKMTNGFSSSNYVETLTQPSNTQVKNKNSVTKTLQDWIFCCNDQNSLKNCNTPGLFCSNTCDHWHSQPLSIKKRLKETCPNNPCTWTHYDINGTPFEVDINHPDPTDPQGIKMKNLTECTCQPILPSQFNNILLNFLSPYEVSMMRSGIPDSDSVWGLDTVAQTGARTHPIGPIQFISEIIGFDFLPGWDEKTCSPRTPGQHDSSSKEKNWFQVSPPRPAAAYSSSSFTFLGLLLWLLDDTKGKQKNWWEIDVNKMLPIRLQNLLHFAGTSGNGGKKFMRIHPTTKELYYSYNATVADGGIVLSPIKNCALSIPNSKEEPPCAMSSTVQTSKEIIDPIDKTTGLVDWDSSSGLFCGNSWGKPSNLAEIYVNILSYNAPNPIVDKDIFQSYIWKLVDIYNNPSLRGNILQAPACLGAWFWSEPYTYNAGIMGPDWVGPFDKNSDSTYATIPAFGHLGETYGNTTAAVFFPGNVKSDPYWGKPSPSTYEPTYSFFGANDFTIVCSQNNELSAAQDAIQYFIYSIIDDPFDWSGQEAACGIVNKGDKIKCEGPNGEPCPPPCTAKACLSLDKNCCFSSSPGDTIPSCFKRGTLKTVEETDTEMDASLISSPRRGKRRRGNIWSTLHR